MERLTFEGNFCDIAQCQELPCTYNGSCFPRKVWERLKAYEETGLTPEEIVKMGIAYEDNKRYSVRLEGRLKAYEEPRLLELAKADREGRVVVLPCKVGDGLWTFCNHPVEQVYSFTVTDISTLNGRTMLNTSRCGVIDARDVGKTVFLTREEAEKALEAMKDE